MNNICTGSVKQLYVMMLCHLCPPWKFFLRHNPRSITKAEGVAINKDMTAQRITIDQK